MGFGMTSNKKKAAPSAPVRASSKLQDTRFAQTMSRSTEDRVHAPNGWITNEIGQEETHGSTQTLGATADPSNEMRASYVEADEMLYLYVLVMEARNLAAADLSGKSDPYCKVQINGKTEAKTEIIENTLDPYWNQTLCIPMEASRLCCGKKGSPICVSVWDYDTFRVGKPDFLGQITIPAHDFKVTGRKSMTSGWIVDDNILSESFEWRTLEKRQGKTDKNVKGEIRCGAWWGGRMDFKTGVQQEVEYTEPEITYLSVFVRSARNLAAMDRNGTSDPFAKITLGSHNGTCSTTSWQTKTKLKTLNPIWNEKFVLPVLDPATSDDFITIAVYDYDRHGENDSIGRIQVPLKNIPMAESAAARPKWYALRPKGQATSQKPHVHVGDIRLELCLEGGYKLPTERPVLGELSCMVLRAINLKNAVMDTPDPYVVAKFGKKWVRSTTVRDSVYPQFNMSVSFNVYEMSDVLSIALFDDNHQSTYRSIQEKVVALGKNLDALMGRVDIRVSSLGTNAIYNTTFPLYKSSSSEVPFFAGSLLLNLSFKCHDLPALYQSYITQQYPDAYYLKPMPFSKLVEKERQNIVGIELARRNIPIRLEVSTEVMKNYMDEFSSRRTRANVDRIKRVLPDYTRVTRFLDYIAEWENPFVTILFQTVFCFLVYNAHLILPLLFTVLFLSTVLGYLRSTGITMNISDDRQEEVEELSAEDVKNSKNPIAAMKAKLDSFKGYAKQVQDILGIIAESGERIESIFSWQDPRMSVICMAGFLGAACMSYIVPFRFGLCSAFVFLMRPPSMKKPTPTPPINMFERMSSKTHLMM
ncbi:hypothetical protein CYMTET_12140 [Cymbomonas tetramitiformis]|uniref:C2 domain-containing protein n=1 Tax=Cymbomonas tetramitiformis TaxID=36881 RepID=A0AAE0GL60_9CHLO|nr:hypothetical protein CYMTET_12140 [Cymbomonas tetramitiformis]